MSEIARCTWVSDHPVYKAYHDNEWGVPCYDEQALFEMLCLEGQQAGLSWITILKKRENYRDLFAFFDPEIVANFTDEYLDQVLLDSGIIRNRLKIYGIRKNALAYLQIQNKYGSFKEYIWSFVGGKPIKNSFTSIHDIPTETKASLAMSKSLKKEGFTFVGSKICYAFMQATGMVNDHTQDCFKYQK